MGDWEPAEWKLDDEGNAVFIDQEDDGTYAYVKDNSMGDWADLPDLVIEKILSYLPLSERYHCSLVCKSWYDAFHSPAVWHTFVLEDKTLSRKKFNLCSGWQAYLDKLRSHIFLNKMGDNIRQLIFAPMYNVNSTHKLYQFMNLLSGYANHYSLHQINSLKFTFSCSGVSTFQRGEMANNSPTSASVYGTGGEMIRSLKVLMSQLPNLTNLELINLLLEGPEALYLLDTVCLSCCLTMRSLTLINATKIPCQLLHAGVFLKLRTLYISPQNLGPDLVWLLSQLQYLQHVHIIQDAYTVPGTRGVESFAWADLAKSNPTIQVHLKYSGKVKKPSMIWQQKAPVSSIVYQTPYSEVSNSDIITVVDHYRTRLKLYGHLELPRFHRSKSFQERIDMSMVQMVRQCSHLHTLVIRERISTATLLLIAHWGKSLRRLYVRRNALILRADWPRSPDWSDEFYLWLKQTARSYELTEKQVSCLLAQPSWRALDDRKFKLIKINVHFDP